MRFLNEILGVFNHTFQHVFSGDFMASKWPVIWTVLGAILVLVTLIRVGTAKRLEGAEKDLVRANFRFWKL